MANTTPAPVHLALDHPNKGELTVFWGDGRASR